jgi:glycosyltransferase involved in cell wall biosynthesis
MSVTFTVVIAAHEAAAELARLLAALEKLERPSGGFEVVVVDDGSKDGTAELATSAPLSVRLLRTKGGAGRSLCRELGWRAAQGEVIVFLDPQMLVEPSWLLAYQDALSDRAVGVAGGERRARRTEQRPHRVRDGSYGR